MVHTGVAMELYQVKRSNKVIHTTTCSSFRDEFLSFPLSCRSDADTDVMNVTLNCVFACSGYDFR